MKNKIILKKIKKIYMYIIIMLIIFISLTLFYLNKKAMPIIQNYACFEMKKISIEILRSISLDEINDLVKNNRVYIVEKDKEGKIESIDFDTVILNKALVIVSKSVKKRLHEIQRGYNLPSDIKNSNIRYNDKNIMIYNVPLGIIYNNYFFSSKGPKIPVKIEYSSDVGVDVKTSVKEYGVNSAVVEAYILVEVVQKTMLPFSSKEIKITTKVPIIINVIKGNVSNYISSSNLN